MDANFWCVSNTKFRKFKFKLGSKIIYKKVIRMFLYKHVRLPCVSLSATLQNNECLRLWMIKLIHLHCYFLKHVENHFLEKGLPGSLSGLYDKTCLDAFFLTIPPL